MVDDARRDSVGNLSGLTDSRLDDDAEEDPPGNPAPPTHADGRGKVLSRWAQVGVGAADMWWLTAVGGWWLEAGGR